MKVHFPKNNFNMKVDGFAKLKQGLYLWIRPKWKALCYTIYAIKLLDFLDRTYYIFTNDSDFEERLEILATYPLAVLAVMKLSYLLMYKRDITKLFTIVEQHFWDPTIVEDSKLLKSINLRFFLVNRLLMNHLTVACSLCIYSIFTKPLTIPIGKTRGLPSPIIIPFIDQDASPLHEVLQAISVWDMLMTIFGNAFFDFVFVYCAQHLCIQYMLLKVLVQNLTADVLSYQSDLEKFQSKDFQREVFRRLALCVRHHNVLQYYGTMLRDNMSFVLGVQLFFTLTLLVIVGFNVVNHFEYNRIQIMYMMILISVVIQFVIFAVQSTEIAERSTSVATAAYLCKWHLFRAKAKRGLTLLIMNSQAGIEMMGAGLIPINNELIVTVFRRAFSCITLLQSFGEEAV